MAKNKTRRNKTEGGKRRKNKTEGGKRRKTRKMSKGATAWTDAVTTLYRKMKKENPDTKFKDALVEASRLKKKGQL